MSEKVGKLIDIKDVPAAQRIGRPSRDWKKFFKDIPKGKALEVQLPRRTVDDALDRLGLKDTYKVAKRGDKIYVIHLEK